MGFKQWLAEDAHRTACKVPHYPPQYDTHGFSDKDFPLIHVPVSADILTWIGMKIKPFHWTNFDHTKG